MKIEGLYIQNTKGDLINIDNLNPSDYQSLFDYIKQAKETTERIDKELAEHPICINAKCVMNHSGSHCTCLDATKCEKRRFLECTNCECSHNIKGKYCGNAYPFKCTDRKPY